MADAPARAAPGRFECVIPILSVRDLRASVEHYTRALGFKHDWGEGGAAPDMASVSRDGCALMLCQGGQGGPGTWVWFGVDDVGPLHEELEAAGAHILLPPTNYPWALEMRVQDPDGHVLRFGSDPRKDRPFSP